MKKQPPSWRFPTNPPHRFPKGNGGFQESRRRNKEKRDLEALREFEALASRKRTRRQQALSDRLREVEHELVCAYRPDEPELLDLNAVDLYLKHEEGSDELSKDSKEAKPDPDQVIYPYRNFTLSDDQSGLRVCVEASDAMHGVTVADLAGYLGVQKLP
ncbi:unnamed protein product [Vitrella brassicaformis CCMP3155]|uniref:Uncharacterized protein n=1 Tax=Vitrella brassicaformis (strain CCMP3155) TaxID=1169540 RepID=A0A0G4FZA8_VITBC|nr:unnamed protein product [Vitrella brassicaformis CCMP3155]|eukprot:CEM20959.1 unnamed protein product [Vitrella brassicaformis CCMP3155]